MWRWNNVLLLPPPLSPNNLVPDNVILQGGGSHVTIQCQVIRSRPARNNTKHPPDGHRGKTHFLNFLNQISKDHRLTRKKKVNLLLWTIVICGLLSSVLIETYGRDWSVSWGIMDNWWMMQHQYQSNGGSDLILMFALLIIVFQWFAAYKRNWMVLKGSADVK